MSKFFRALEQAERERALVELARPSAPREVAEPARPPAPGPAPTAEPETDRSPSVAAALESAVGVDVAPVGDAPTDGLERGVAEPPSLYNGEPEEAESHLVSLLEPTSFAAEQYRTLRHIIEHAGTQVVAVTSPGVGDGKTTTAVNLAGALAQAPEARVLIMDCDLRRPNVGKFIGLPSDARSRGFVDLLLDRRLTLESVVVSRRPYNLDILPAGRVPTNPYEVLKSPRLPSLMEEARARYHFIILDTPPAIPLPDFRVLGKVADGLVVIVSANKTPRRLVQEALEILDRDKVVGLIFNKDRSPVGGYYDYQAYFPSQNGKGKSGLARLMSRVRSLRPKPATQRKHRN
jgi:capsular exopolysaccharide synthesis family protein